jgi:hypothetical protein
MLQLILAKGPNNWTIADLFYLYDALGHDEYNRLVKNA